MDFRDVMICFVGAVVFAIGMWVICSATRMFDSCEYEDEDDDIEYIDLWEDDEF